MQHLNRHIVNLSAQLVHGTVRRVLNGHSAPTSYGLATLRGLPINLRMNLYCSVLVSGPLRPEACIATVLITVIQNTKSLIKNSAAVIIAEHKLVT